MGSGYRWLIQNWDQVWLDGTVVIAYDTDIPVHAWLCHSTEPPNMHLLTKTVRGLRVMGSPYYCFPKQDCFEQDEAGDTLHHTFTWPGWYVCLWQWFFFKATVAGVWTPTQWGIFKKHKEEAPPLVPTKQFECFPPTNFTLRVDKWNFCGTTFILNDRILLSHVVAYLQRNLTFPATTVCASIYHTAADGRPWGLPLVSKTVDVSNIVRQPRWEAVTFEFDERILLDAGRRYIMWLTAVDGWPYHEIHFRCYMANACPNTFLVRYRGDIDQWYFYPDYDGTFQVWGEIR